MPLSSTRFKMNLSIVKPTDDDQRIAILEKVGYFLTSKRSEAVTGKAQCGVEEIWLQDEEFYQGYDDANRHEFGNNTTKPTATGQMRHVDNKQMRYVDNKETGSTVFPNITQPYVDAVSARVGDMLLPTDERNFAVDLASDNNTALEPSLSAQAAPQAAPGQAAPGQPPEPAGQEGQLPTLSAEDQAKAEKIRVREEKSFKAKLVEDQIDDWLQESQYFAEIRKVIDDCARLGSGVIKGPIPVKRRTGMWKMGQEGTSSFVLVEEIKPASLRVDPWNLFPDPACGESIHNGSYIFERDFLTTKKLEDLKGIPGYIDSQIDKCLKEGPGNRKEADRRNNTATKEQFEIWYAHILITSEEMEACGCEVGKDKKSYPALMTLVNDHVIRAALNPLDSGEFPYDVIPWKRRPLMPWGTGLGRQLRTPQRMIVAATRKLAENAGLGSGPMFVVRRGVQPENGIWEIQPLKIWIEEDDSTGGGASPVSSIVIPMMQVELTNIIQLGMKMAEDVTGFPALMQGQQGSAPDTVGGMQILNQNANSVLRRIARLFDASITEPHMRRYFSWLQAYGENDEMRGDFAIIARGSTALVERDIQSNEMSQVMQMSLNPAFGINPKRAFSEYLKSRRFDPSAFSYTEAEQKKIDEQQAPPPPQIQVAQIREEGAMKRAEMEATVDAQLARLSSDTKVKIANDAQETSAEKMRIDTDRDTAFVQAQTEQNQLGHQAKMTELELKRELALLEYTNRQQITLTQAKTDLAQTTMKLQTQKQLADMASDSYRPKQVATPAIEPRGRAPAGQAFQK